MSILSQRVLAGGEISPALSARADTTRFQTGLAKLRNAFVLKHGSVANRPGFKFGDLTKDSASRSRLIDFDFGLGQTYALLFSPSLIRFIKNGEYICETSITISSYTQANPAVFTTGIVHGFSAGDWVYIDLNIDHLADEAEYPNGRLWEVATTPTTTTFTVKDADGNTYDATNATPEGLSKGTVRRVYAIASPYTTEDHIFELQYSQSGDTMVLVHPSYDPRELVRTSDTSWAINSKSFTPSISAPTGVSIDGGVSTAASWVVTAVKSETYEESVASSVATGNIPTSGSPRTVSWTVVSGAVEYNVYRAVNGIYGLVGIAGTNSFVDTGVTPDTSDTPPAARNPFSGSDNRPSVTAFGQSRIWFAASNNNPETVYGSRTGQYSNFSISSPLQDDDAVTFTLVGQKVNIVRHILELNQLVLFTSSAERVAKGDADGFIRPTAINQKAFTYNGCSTLRPIPINTTALYVQEDRKTVRDLVFDYTVDGYNGNDLTRFVNHLLDGFTIIDWCYQQTPHSVVWAVRSDGKLLSLTYIKEEQIYAWALHETDGEVESICSIQETGGHAVYIVVKRITDNGTYRYWEYLSPRIIDENAVEDCFFVDSGVTWNGWNPDSWTVTLTTGGGWTYQDALTATFNTSDVHYAGYLPRAGDELHINLNGDIYRFSVTAVNSATAVTVVAQETVPVALRNTATVNWGRAKTRLTGLQHLEGLEVSALGDARVMASPNNSAYTVVAVTDGIAGFDSAAVVIQCGLPYTTDIESLEIETLNSETYTNKAVNFSNLWARFYQTRGVFAGTEEPSGDDPLENLVEMRIRRDEDYSDPIELLSGKVDLSLYSEWKDRGKVFIRQVDPLPMNLLAFYPEGNITGGK